MGRMARIKKAKKKITELVNKGVQFNPQAVSGHTLTAAGASGTRNITMRDQSKVERQKRVEVMGSSERPIPKDQRFDNEAVGKKKPKNGGHR